MVADAMRLRWGIQTAIEDGISDVDFLIDAQVVANCFHQGTPLWLLLNQSFKTADISFKLFLALMSISLVGRITVLPII